MPDRILNAPDPARYGDVKLLLAALVVHAERMGDDLPYVTEEDVARALDLEIEIERVDYADGAFRLVLRRRQDPRRAAIRRAIEEPSAREPYSPEGRERLIDRILEELDRG